MAIFASHFVTIWEKPWTWRSRSSTAYHVPKRKSSKPPSMNFSRSGGRVAGW